MVYKKIVLIPVGFLPDFYNFTDYLTLFLVNKKPLP
jgi:hypothetical protein